ncbi:hypothetical protein ACS0TY_036086 [Phlomoides rotata]
MEEIHNEEFLCLKLAINHTYPQCERKRKRKEVSLSLDSETLDSSESSESYEEGKLLALFQIRDRMQKLDPQNKEEDNESNDDDVKGLNLIHLLLMSSTLVNENNIASAVENLCQLYKNVCVAGDSVQRVAAYFADGLVARLLTRESPFYGMIMKGPTHDEEFVAFMDMYKASPFYQFAHFTANQAIVEAFERQESGGRALHVIDFNVSYGFQWPSLMQSLSEKAGPTSRISLRITGFGRSADEIRETEARLVSFARGFRNLVFEFNGLVGGRPKMRRGEVVAINLVFNLSSINSYSKISDMLKYVHSMNPALVVLVEQEGSKKTHNFLSRFMESLHYYAAIFDSLDDRLPLDSSERSRIEKNLLGKEIKHVMNCDKGSENCLRFESMETWKGRMESHGFCGVRQSLKSSMQAKLLLKMTSNCSNSVQLDGENGGFRVVERDDGRAISLGWQERLLITASSWCCV